MDDLCSLKDGQVHQGFKCLLNFTEGNSDKFYVLQLLTNGQEYFVWTRWGRNGTKGQSKLEGPIDELNAEKNFKKKFQDKTKNKWDERENFVPVKGKYVLVKEKHNETTDENISLLSSFESEKPDFSNTVISGVCLHGDILCHIMSFLNTKEVLRCMQVCRFWKEILSEKYFWKMFICQRFDLKLKTNVSEEAPYCQWKNDDDWYSYLDDEEDPFDPFLFRPFPSMWNCRVVHPFGLDPLVGSVKSLQGFSRSLEIITKLKQGIDELGLSSGNQCSASEGQDSICVVMFPWEHKQLPTTRQLIDQVFHFHPEVIKDCLRGKEDGCVEKSMDKLYYHIPKNDSDEEEDEDHDMKEKPCLNRIFGCFVQDDDKEFVKKAHKFYSWLQSIMVPCKTEYVGSDKFNPVVVFSLTNLAPGWVGGALTGVTYT